ncbi:hypothetical protein IIU_06937 [Bacillus cereus VD133]|uniref:Uncharacterized protein n=1 Tax=Bacillus cereus VD133 TaxID=1053233 RepID=A0A9W5PJA8_BACCE|nr:hypothetical protein [Bacillus cereus]EOO23733.1 hypothetical protein IIU_06937 [Bacillus cereus VD133]
MKNNAFSTHGLGGKTSPFLLTKDEWTYFIDLLNKCSSAPTSIEDVQEHIYSKLDGKFKTSWDRLIETYAFSTMVKDAIEINKKLRVQCGFWGDGGKASFLFLSQNIVDYANFICVDHINDLNKVIQEVQGGKVSSEMKSKFVKICNDLSNHAQTYLKNAQPLIESISTFYEDIENCEEELNRVKDLIPQIPMYNSDDFGMANVTVIFLMSSIIDLADSKEGTVPILNKIHGIWDALSYDLKETGEDIEKGIVDVDSFIAGLELELAIEDWRVVGEEANNFYQNINDFKKCNYLST